MSLSQQDIDSIRAIIANDNAVLVEKLIKTVNRTINVLSALKMGEVVSDDRWNLSSSADIGEIILDIKANNDVILNALVEGVDTGIFSTLTVQDIIADEGLIK